MCILKSLPILCLFISINLNCSNQLTIASYEAKAEEYVKITPAICEPVEEWINKALSYINKQDSILEVGSGFGRDAKYIESLGYKIQRSDATKAFLKILSDQGYEAKYFNVLTDELDKGYCLIFANSVFVHFTPKECEIILHKILRGLTSKGILAFSMKYGEGTQWSHEIGAPRFYCYWKPDDLQKLLIKIGYEIVDMTIKYESATKRIYVIARKL